MNRREFILSLGGAMTAARELRALQKTMPVIGYLSLASPGSNAANVAAFRQGLGDTGYVEGQNVAIEYRWAEGRHDRLAALAADLVGRKLDVIMASGGTGPAQAAKNATSTIPIVFTGGDPVAAGLVASLARPGGNLTGMTFMTTEVLPKQLELLSGTGDRYAREPERSPYRSLHRRIAGSGARERLDASHPKGRHRKRNRRRFRHISPAGCRGAPRRGRLVLLRPTGPARGTGVTPCRAGDL